jgi:hypothetical protein
MVSIQANPCADKSFDTINLFYLATPAIVQTTASTGISQVNQSSEITS